MGIHYCNICGMLCATDESYLMHFVENHEDYILETEPNSLLAFVVTMRRMVK